MTISEKQLICMNVCINSHFSKVIFIDSKGAEKFYNTVFWVFLKHYIVLCTNFLNKFNDIWQNYIKL